MQSFLNRFLLIGLLTSFSVLLAGCGSDGTVQPKSTVQGKVSYQGAPVTGGVVTFHSTAESGAAPAAGQINDDGTYKVSNAEPGPVRITIDTSFQEGLPTYVELPAELSKPDTSGLTYDVKDGEQEHDLIIP